nr:Zinc knuckle family protein [Ipomoea batatas]
MTSRKINGFAATPNYDGEEDSVFTIKLHLGGDMIFKPRFSYKNGLVEYFDHFNCDEGSILDLRRMVKQLRFCDKKAQFWYQYGNPRRPKLMKLSSDADILGLITDIPVNKELDIYVEHLYDDQWDYDVEISRELGDDTLLHDDVFSEDESRGSDSVGEQDDENQVDVDGPSIQRNHLRDTATSSKPKGGLEEQAEDFVEVECNLSEQILRSLCDSDSEGAAQGPLNVFEERNLKKEGFKFEIGMVFSSAKEFNWAVQYHEAMRQKDVIFKKNEHRRVRAICRHNQICQWTIFGSSSNQNSPFTVKTYNPVHICGNQDENKVVTSGFLAKVFKDDFRVNKDWPRGAFQEHVRSKFNCQLTRNQAYLAKKKALKKIDGLDSEQFLLLNDYCEELRRSNPGSTVKMNCILNFRDKPIQTMCEKLRLYLMTRMQRNRDRMMSYPFKVCPRILKLIEEGKEKSARFSAYKSVDEIYQVDDDNFKAYKVDLSSRQCSCKRWDLSGIPCTHAIAAIRKKGDLPENHVHACYSVEHYLRAYGPAILPIRAQELWHKTGMPSPLPPKYKPQPGRPKKKRKIDPAVEKQDLKKATKKGELKKCKLCGMRGHNRTTCKGKSQQVPQPPSQAVPEPDSHVPENNDLQNAFQDVVVETQVPEFLLNEMDSMSSQPAQPETNDIPTVADFISDTIDNEPTPARKFVTVAGIKYTCTATWFRGKGK